MLAGRERPSVPAKENAYGIDINAAGLYIGKLIK